MTTFVRWGEIKAPTIMTSRQREDRLLGAPQLDCMKCGAAATWALITYTPSEVLNAVDVIWLCSECKLIAEIDVAKKGWIVLC